MAGPDAVSWPARAPSLVICGGGLAGIAAALRAADGGFAVTLVETRKRLGGRATSFVDPASGQLLDNCQHVLMACCTHLIDLYRRLGVADRIEWHRRLHFLDGGGRLDTLEGDDLPPPLHLSRALLGFRSLTWREKLAIARGMLAVLRLGRRGRAAWHRRSFADWLREHDQPAGAVEKFWAVVAVSAINERPERMAADAALQVFQEAFLSHEAAYVMGLPAVPLVELYDAAERVLAERGGRVLLSTSVQRIVMSADRVTGVETDGAGTLAAEAVVSALPFDRLAKVCTAEMLTADERLRRLGELEVSPIIGVHLWLASPAGAAVMDLPHVVLTQSPLQWVFNKGWDACGGGQHLHGVISAAHDLADRPADTIAALAEREVERALPAARGAKLLRARVIKEKRATFSARPGADELRPGARGAIGNLYLAGDWCRTGWPATMEGAVRSGNLAAAAALEDAGLRAPPAPADMPEGPLYRLLAGA